MEQISYHDFCKGVLMDTSGSLVDENVVEDFGEAQDAVLERDS